MTWEMSEAALSCILEVYHPRLKIECDLLFTGNQIEGEGAKWTWVVDERNNRCEFFVMDILRIR